MRLQRQIITMNTEMYLGSWCINMSYGVMEKCNKKTLMLKINLSHAICNSKNEDTFCACYLYVKFLSPTFLLCHTIGHGPIFLCQLPICSNHRFSHLRKHCYLTNQSNTNLS